jgi:hypothetical protein
MRRAPKIVIAGAAHRTLYANDAATGDNCGAVTVRQPTAKMV